MSHDRNQPPSNPPTPPAPTEGGSTGSTSIAGSTGNVSFPNSPPNLPTTSGPNYSLSTNVGGSTLVGKPGKKNQLTATAANVTLVGGPGSDTFIVHDPSDVVIGNGGVDTVETSGSGYTLPAGIDNLILLGSAIATATGNSGNNIIVANAGTDVIAGGVGNDILKAGTGADTFVVAKQANATTWIEGFKTSGAVTDKIDLTAYGFQSFAAVQAAMTQSGSNVAINLGGGELLMLQGKQLSSITATNLIGLPASPPPPPPPSAPPTPPPAASAVTLPPAPSAPPNLPTSGMPNNWLSTYTQGATLTGDPTKNNQLSANALYDTLVGGPGNDLFVAYDPATKIIPNGGIDTVETWGSGYTLPTGVANLTLEGSANSYATGNSGNNIIIGNAGTDTLTTGGGNDILQAGTGADTFVITKDTGTTTWVEGFKTSGTATDTLDLSQFGFQSFAAAQAAMAQVGSNVEISVGGGQIVMLQNEQLSSLNAGNVRTTFTPAGLHLTFDDEFNSLSLNMGTASTAGGTWTTYYSGFGVRSLTGNQEQEIYVDPSYAGTSGAPLGLNPFSDQNGILTISAAPAPAADLPYLSGFQYTSGMLNTENSFSQTYGYFDMRAQLPAGGQGLWPAFWLLKNSNTWPPEIDVLEQVSNPASNIFSTVIDSSQPNQQGSVNVGDTSTGFHDYGVLWTPQTITFYFDGRQLLSTPTPADMNSPMYMIMNLALGGSWAGSPNASTNWALANMKIDYVRAYSLTPTATSGAPAVTFSNATDPTNLASSFAVPTLAPSTSSTYTAGQLNIVGVDPAATVTTTTDVNDNLTVTNNGAWGAINDVTIKSAVNANVTVNNFVDAQISLGNGDSEVTVNDAMRGTISVGNGNDTISVVAESNATANNTMTITAGDGQDQISFRGASNTAALITAGNLGNTITVDGQASATVKSGTGNDDFIDKSTGSLTLTGGGGTDIFEFLAGAHATITDFQAGQDSIVLHGLTASQVQVTVSQGNTFIALGSGSQVELAGVSLTTSQLHMIYA
ncbi:MAG TPA: family 16 glycosylhydrolase [Stellaceae bacterium]|nr:family 16 glycosylhydrolase [Stellaceae bacterium]